MSNHFHHNDMMALVASPGPTHTPVQAPVRARQWDGEDWTGMLQFLRTTFPTFGPGGLPGWPHPWMPTPCGPSHSPCIPFPCPPLPGSCSCDPTPDNMWLRSTGTEAGTYLQWGGQGMERSRLVPHHCGPCTPPPCPPQPCCVPGFNAVAGMLPGDKIIHVFTDRGIMSMRPSDWAVQNERGCYMVYSDVEFKKFFVNLGFPWPEHDPSDPTLPDDPTNGVNPENGMHLVLDGNQRFTIGTVAQAGFRLTVNGLPVSLGEVLALSWSGTGAFLEPPLVVEVASDGRFTLTLSPEQVGTAIMTVIMTNGNSVYLNLLIRAAGGTGGGSEGGGGTGGCCCSHCVPSQVTYFVGRNHCCC